MRDGQGEINEGEIRAEREKEEWLTRQVSLYLFMLLRHH